MRIVSLVTIFCLLLAACETVEGFGRDVSKVGEELEDAASK